MKGGEIVLMKGNSSLRTDKEFAFTYNRNADMIYRIAFMIVGNKAEAEDAVQTVFMRYLKNRPEFNKIEHEKAWFIKTTKNYCRDILKCWWRSRKSDEDMPEHSYISFIDEEENIKITEAMNKLPVKYKEILYLYYYEEYSIKEISRILARNESTIRTQLCKGREKIKKQLISEVNYDKETLPAIF